MAHTWSHPARRAVPPNTSRLRTTFICTWLELSFPLSAARDRRLPTAPLVVREHWKGEPHHHEPHADRPGSRDRCPPDRGGDRRARHVVQPGPRGPRPAHGTAGPARAATAVCHRLSAC